MRNLLLFFCIIILGAGCNKKEEIIIPGNNPPADTTLPSGIEENFVNKAYITLLGREPSAEELASSLTILYQSSFSGSARAQVAGQILDNPEFYTREYDLARASLLNNLDTFQIADVINTFNYLLEREDQQAIWPLVQYELQRAERLRDAPGRLRAGEISIAQLHRICIDNFFYDDINMGSLNFVISSFQHFMLRNATEAEQREGVKIVDGFPGILFLKVTEGKQGYLDVFFASQDYYEGQVKSLFNRFIFRNPNTEEMVKLGSRYKESGDYKELVKTIISGAEFARLSGK